jgi:hypothetical protein
MISPFLSIRRRRRAPRWQPSWERLLLAARRGEELAHAARLAAEIEAAR